MSDITKTSDFKLPSIAEIYSDTGMGALQKDSAFQILINNPPPQQWIKNHPTAKIKVKDDKGNEKSVPAKYIPIERIEWLLVNIFLKYKVKIKKVQLIANSVVVTVRLKYYDHIAKEWHWQDGVGAAPLQTDQGAGATDFMKMKSHAVMLAAPSAESYAIKDAAEKIGKLFGKDLNRADAISFDTLTDRYANAFTDAD